MRVNTNKLLCLSVVVLLLVAGVGSPVSAQSGHKQVDKLMDRAADTIGSIRAARLQISTTLDGYNMIMDGEVEDNRAAYKQLEKALSKSEKSVVAVGARAEKMELVATEFFASWESSLAEFGSDEMRARSEERMNDTRQRYDGILTAGREAGDAFAPFVTQLKDQILFLGHDLNTGAIKELSEDAKKLNGQAEKVFSRVDETIESAQTYRASMKPD